MKMCGANLNSVRLCRVGLSAAVTPFSYGLIFQSLRHTTSNILYIPFTRDQITQLSKYQHVSGESKSRVFFPAAQNWTVSSHNKRTHAQIHPIDLPQSERKEESHSTGRKQSSRATSRAPKM